MRITLLGGLAAAAFMTSLVATSAQAQMVLTSPNEIRSCLCLQQSVTALDGGVVQQRQAHEKRRQELEALDAEVNAQRSQINVNNFAQVEAFKHLIEQRDKAAADFSGPATASYAQAVARYNAAVGQFNSFCASKAYDSVVRAQVQGSLSCPATR
jgi:hypothetical protein